MLALSGYWFGSYKSCGEATKIDHYASVSFDTIKPSRSSIR